MHPVARSARDEARRLLGEGRAAEAVRLYEEHLEANDDDDEARLEYGIACLVMGDRDRFIEVGMEYAPCMSPVTLERLGGRIRSLWAEYAAVCARIARAAAVGASVAIACQAGGCGCRPAAPDAAAEVATSPPPEVAEPTPPPVTQTIDAGAPEVAQEPPPAKPKPKPRPYIPKTRYVAVHLDKDDVF